MRRVVSIVIAVLLAASIGYAVSPEDEAVIEIEPGVIVIE